MAKVKVPIAGTTGKSVRIDSRANEGATLGVDLKLPDGQIATVASLAALLGTGTPADVNPLSVTLWRLVREKPPNIVEVENLATSGLVTRLADGSWVTRDLETDDGTFISVSNPGGELGNPSVDVDFAANILWTGQHQFDLGPTVWDGALYQDVVLDTRQIIAGAGLTGTSDLSADVTLAVGAGVGIAVNADDVALSHLGLEALTDPAADRIAFWDDSAGAFDWLTVGTGLDITGTTLTATGGGGGGNLNDLGDVTIDTPLDEQILRYNSGTSQWENVDLLLNGVGDVTITTPAIGETWYFDGANWVNTDAITVDPAGATVVQHNGVAAFQSIDIGLAVLPSSNAGNPGFSLNDAVLTERFRFFATTAAAGFRSVLDGMTTTLQGFDSGSVLRNTMVLDPDGAATAYYNGVEELRTAQHDATDFLSGAEVKDRIGNFRQVGFQDLVAQSVSANRTVSAEDFARGLLRNTSGTNTYTLNTLSEVASNMMLNILVQSGGVTLAEGTGVTIRWADGSAIQEGNRTISVGSVATIWKLQDDFYYVWGNGLS